LQSQALQGLLECRRCHTKQDGGQSQHHQQFNQRQASAAIAIGDALAARPDAAGGLAARIMASILAPGRWRDAGRCW
jgi:hypothetical protein